jgi:hypothetical protein
VGAGRGGRVLDRQMAARHSLTQPQTTSPDWGLS